MIYSLPLIVLFSVLILYGTFFIVKQQSAAIVERFGKFTSVRHSGLQLKIPIIDRVAGRLSLRIQQLDVVVETKTKDDVFVKVKVSVQYKVIKDKVYDAFYKLDYPELLNSIKITGTTNSKLSIGFINSITNKAYIRRNMEKITTLVKNNLFLY